jgi:hypothetical protein
MSPCPRSIAPTCATRQYTFFSNHSAHSPNTHDFRRLTRGARFLLITLHPGPNIKRTYTTDERLQTRRDPLTADQRRPVHVVPAVRARREHVLVGNVDCRHGHVVRFGKLANVPIASVPLPLLSMLFAACFDFATASRAAAPRCVISSSAGYHFLSRRCLD